MTDHESSEGRRGPPEPDERKEPDQPRQPDRPSEPGPAFPPAGTPGWGQPAPAPPASNRTRNIVLTILAVVLALCCCGGAVGGYLIKKATDGIGPARAAADSFIGDLESGDTDSAYDRLCAPTQSRFSREQFEQGLTTRPKITRHTIAGVTVTSSNGVAKARVTARLTDEAGFTDTHVFELVKEIGDWKICGDPY
jgi:hypothetical protein